MYPSGDVTGWAGVARISRPEYCNPFCNHPGRTDLRQPAWAGDGISSAISLPYLSYVPLQAMSAKVIKKWFSHFQISILLGGGKMVSHLSVWCQWAPGGTLGSLSLSQSSDCHNKVIDHEPAHGQGFSPS
jgi:hypothetical protein